MPESTPQKSGEENRDLQVALKSKKIKTCEVESINQALRYAMVKIGLRAPNFPNDEETELLIDHVKKNYGNHTTEEIKLAFDMAITGQLDLEKGESVNCYENFCCLYFSSIMTAYRKWAPKALKFQEKKFKEIPQLMAPPVDDNEIIADALGIWNATKRFEFISESSYESLVRTGKINLSTEEKKKFMEAAVIPLLKMEEKDPFVFKHNDRASFQKIFAKKLAVMNYFESIPK